MKISGQLILVMLFKFFNFLVLSLMLVTSACQNKTYDKEVSELVILCKELNVGNSKDFYVKDVAGFDWDSIYVFYNDQMLENITWKNLKGLENYTGIDFDVVRHSKYDSKTYSVLSFIKDRKVIKTVDLATKKFKIIDPNYRKNDFYIAGYHNHYFYPRNSLIFIVTKTADDQCHIKVKY